MANLAAQRSREHLSATLDLHLSEMLCCLQAGDVTDNTYPLSNSGCLSKNVYSNDEHFALIGRQ